MELLLRGTTVASRIPPAMTTMGQRTTCTATPTRTRDNEEVNEANGAILPLTTVNNAPTAIPTATRTVTAGGLNKNKKVQMSGLLLHFL